MEATHDDGPALAPGIHPAVVVVLDTQGLRAHPKLKRLDGIIAEIPQWKSAFAGVRPLRDIDWLALYGPSLVRTDRSVLVARTAMTDDALARAIAEQAKHYDKGGAVRLAAPDVKAWRTYADNAERVAAIPQPKLLVVAPPKHADEVAGFYERPDVGAPRPGELARFRVQHPARALAVPGVPIPESTREVRIVVAGAGADADVTITVDCEDARAATLLAGVLDDRVREARNSMANMLTGRVLDRVRFEAVGATVTSQFPMKSEQLERLLGMAEAYVGVH